MRIRALRTLTPIKMDILKKFNAVQIFNASNVYGLEHVRFAFEKAKAAFENGDAVSSNLFVEVMVRASGQRQIKKAIELFGIEESLEHVVFGDLPDDLHEVLGAADFEIILDDARLARLKEVFSISDEELSDVESSAEHPIISLINERIALTSVI